MEGYKAIPLNGMSLHIRSFFPKNWEPGRFRQYASISYPPPLMLKQSSRPGLISPTWLMSSCAILETPGSPPIQTIGRTITETLMTPRRPQGVDRECKTLLHRACQARCQIVMRTSHWEVLQLYNERNGIAHFLSNV